MDDARPQGDLRDHLAAGHESNSLQMRGLVYSVLALIGVSVVVQLILALVMRGFSGEEKQLEALAVPRFVGDTGGFPAPRIEPDPDQELARMKKEDLGRLADYGWIDRPKGIGQIPIDRAMDILAEKGLPPTGTDGTVPTAGEASKKSSSAEERAKPGRPGEQKP